MAAALWPIYDLGGHAASQPDGISWESIFAEGGKREYPEKEACTQIEIDKSQLTHGTLESIPGRRDWRRE